MTFKSDLFIKILSNKKKEKLNEILRSNNNR